MYDIVVRVTQSVSHLITLPRTHPSYRMCLLYGQSDQDRMEDNMCSPGLTMAPHCRDSADTCVHHTPGGQMQA
jgi:hypothetical protein